MGEAKAKEYQVFWDLVRRAVEVARKICRDGGFDSEITYKTVTACMADPSWAKDYEWYVQDNPFKHGNPRKGAINQEIGYRIRQGIGGEVSKTPKGKSAKVSVTGSIIQSYTPMTSYAHDKVV